MGEETLFSSLLPSLSLFLFFSFSLSPFLFTGPSSVALSCISSRLIFAPKSAFRAKEKKKICYLTDEPGRPCVGGLLPSFRLVYSENNTTDKGDSPQFVGGRVLLDSLGGNPGSRPAQRVLLDSRRHSGYSWILVGPVGNPGSPAGIQEYLSDHLRPLFSFCSLRVPRLLHCFFNKGTPGSPPGIQDYPLCQ